MYLAIVFIPLLGFLTVGLSGWFIGKNGAIFISVGLMQVAVCFSLVSFFKVALGGQFCYVTLGSWINSDFFVVNWGFMFDSLTVSMFLVVNIISFLVHVYSIKYMSEDPHIVRFMSYLSFFTFFMLILVSADNFIQMFLGWEGVGLCSYLLISFWFTRVQANKAAIKALIVNRVGDFGLSIGIIFIFFFFRSVDFATVFALAPFYSGNTFLEAACLLLFVGSVGKSAQLGLHTWLPDAMEGPTPVSALIHAATMVTAGVFLIIRCSPLFEFAPSSLTVITFFGALTAFFAATVGLFQNDIKKVIAYSTCSQLGYMVFACGLSNYSASFFHLANHAFFKALLFLSAGSVIHSLSNEQDMRKMGGLTKVLPFTYTMILVGSLSLMGFPYLTGFYSKDLILELAVANYSFSGVFSYWLGTLAAFMTACYSFRLVYLVFFSTPNGFKSGYANTHELPVYMALPLALLCFGSIFLGYLSKDMVVGLGTPFFGNSVVVLFDNLHMIDAEFVPHMEKVRPVMCSFLGLVVAIFVNSIKANLVGFNLGTEAQRTGKSSLLVTKKSCLEVFGVNSGNFGLSWKQFQKTYSFFNHKWYFDSVYNNYIALPSLKLGYHLTFKLLDKGLIEFLGPWGFPNFIYYVWAQPVSKHTQKGLLNQQLTFMVFFVFVIAAFSTLLV